MASSWSLRFVFVLLPCVTALRCYEDASLSNVTSADVTVEFQSTSWRSQNTFPDGLRQTDCSNQNMDFLYGNSHYCVKLIRENAPVDESITGMCYRPILVLSGLACDANGKSGLIFKPGTDEVEMSYHCCDSDLCNQTSRRQPSLVATLVLSTLSFFALRAFA
mmetsp:Transcript_16523/g.33122  ORF Transcript_16523/g.33122 Transcript_16523/m.33122 type:complete len:163 (-) Transcript_16523:59-547(-)